MRQSLIAVAAAAAMAGPLHAASLSETYSSFFVFGDSLSDTGNLFASAGLPPSPPYFNGRFSNGPVWAEPLIGEFTAAFRPSASFAFGFANAASDDLSVDLFEQLFLFATTVPAAALGPRPLAAVWFGANDVFGAVDDGGDLAAVQATGVAAAQATAAGIGALASLGVTDFLLFNLPDLGATPAYALLDPLSAPNATAGALAFNATLASAADGLRAGGLTITEIDIFALFAALQADPATFGLTDAATPCIPGGVLAVALGLVQPCASADGLAFWDEVHPTAAVHARITQEARAALAPVPLPAALPLMAAALAGLALVRLRRRH